MLASADDDVLAAIDGARAAARARAWAAGARPPKDFIVLDFDATLVTSHSEKEEAKATYRHGFGFHPLLCFVDATNDAVAGVLRPGNAGSNIAVDHIAVLDAAVAQLPVRTTKADPEGGEWMLARADSAAARTGSSTPMASTFPLWPSGTRAPGGAPSWGACPSRTGRPPSPPRRWRVVDGATPMTVAGPGSAGDAPSHRTP